MLSTRGPSCHRQIKIKGQKKTILLVGVLFNLGLQSVEIWAAGRIVGDEKSVRWKCAGNGCGDRHVIWSVCARDDVPKDDVRAIAGAEPF